MTQRQKTGTDFDGLRVIAFESRRAAEMATLIQHQRGAATVVPSMREIALDDNPEAQVFERELLAGRIHMVLCLTGVGVRLLARELETRMSRAQLTAALARTVVVARGPKPMAALRELGVNVDILAPPPNTWREILAMLDLADDVYPLAGHTVAVQEYGVVNPHLTDGLRARGATVMRVPVYRWALPEDTGPLRQAVQDVAAGLYEVALFTTATQVWHLFQIAAAGGLEEPLRQGLQRMVVASIGPTCSEALGEFNVPVALEPPQPRMGHLVKAAAEQSGKLLAGKT